MTRNVEHTLFQSGEMVTVSGDYVVVGTCPSKVCNLQMGERFPNFDGRTVCWHLEQVLPPKPLLPAQVADKHGGKRTIS